MIGRIKNPLIREIMRAYLIGLFCSLNALSLIALIEPEGAKFPPLVIALLVVVPVITGLSGVIRWWNMSKTKRC